MTTWNYLKPLVSPNSIALFVARIVAERITTQTSKPTTMKIETREYKVYSFAELSEEAKKTALEKLRNTNVDEEFWSDCVLEDATEQLAEMGYKYARVYFSGFWSQGDGASFECTVDVPAWLKHASPVNKEKFLKLADISLYAGIKTSGRCSHEYSMTIDIEQVEYVEGLGDLVGELGEAILEDARHEARLIYKKLEKEYEYLTSDDAVIETIEANEYEFLASGKMFTL